MPQQGQLELRDGRASAWEDLCARVGPLLDELEYRDTYVAEGDLMRFRTIRERLELALAELKRRRAEVRG
jgi:hypothetical protein